jgi:predicted house-cleaning noncanonical NTP pyrophosphatase (MazG superfamily)
MQRLMERLQREAQDALKSGNPQKMATCLKWVRDMAKATEEQIETSMKSKEAESLRNNLDVIETLALVNALSRRSKGLVMGLIHEKRPGEEGCTVFYRGGFTQAYGIANRVVMYLECQDTPARVYAREKETPEEE